MAEECYPVHAPNASQTIPHEGFAPDGSAPVKIDEGSAEAGPLGPHLSAFVGSLPAESRSTARAVEESLDTSAVGGEPAHVWPNRNVLGPTKPERGGAKHARPPR